MLRPAYPIETERLTLRPFHEGDLEGLFAYQSLPEVARFLYCGPRTLEESRSFLKQKMGASTVDREGDWLVLAVVRRATGDLIGEVNLQWRSREHRQGEIGYIFNPAYHGKGYATEAAEVVLRLGFDGLDLHRVCVAGRPQRRVRAGAGAPGDAPRGAPAAERDGQGRVDRRGRLRDAPPRVGRPHLTRAPRGPLTSPQRRTHFL